MFAFRSPELPISLSSRQSSPLVFAETHDNRAVHAASGSGGGRSSGDQPQDVGEELSRDGNLGHLEGDIATLAPILISFSFRLVSDREQA
jgi:hypothetical protein